MNILRTATLVAILIKSVTASTDVMSQFHKYVDEGDIVKAVELRLTYSGYSSCMFNYAVDKQEQEFIFDFARQTGVGNSTLLVALHRKKSPQMCEEVLKVFNLDRRDLKCAASEPELMCSPNDLFNILGRIEKQGDQEEAIRSGVDNLFAYERTECLDPLLVALESKEPLKHLKDVAIKGAFKGGLYHGNKALVERFHDHPAVIPEVYAYGLLDSGRRSNQNPTFIFLLGGADQDDLNAVEKHDWYRNRSNEFKKAIEDALLTAKPGGTRSTLPFQRAELAMEIFEEDSSMGIPKVISQLIAFYLVDESILKSITTPVKKTIGHKRKKSDVSDKENA